MFTSMFAEGYYIIIIHFVYNIIMCGNGIGTTHRRKWLNPKLAIRITRMKEQLLLLSIRIGCVSLNSLAIIKSHINVSVH